tara:strand:+ start:1331 stop:2104 length:774 start_codon:yes stop_codon:yes gene_type:complete
MAETSNPHYRSIHVLLKRIGLNEKEISVYLALLATKTAKVVDIAREAKQSRSNTYLILRSIMEKGLASEVSLNGTTHFIAEPPSRLINFTKKKERELQELSSQLTDILPLLQQMTAPLIGKPHVTLSYGLEGMEAIYSDAIAYRFASLFNPKAMYDAFGVNLAMTLATKKQRIRGRDLLVDGPETKRYIKETEPDPEYEYKLLPKRVTFYGDTLIFNDTIVLFPYDSEMTIVRIEHQNLANVFMSYFDFMWESCSVN